MPGDTMSSPLRIAHVSTFPPLKCGVALFASDLISAIPTAEHLKYSLHYGGGAARDACASANVNSIEDVVALAKTISDSDCDVVGLQHEFGIWGGVEGEHLRPFLDHLTKPVVSVLHTTFGPGVRTAVQRDTLLDLIQRSARVVLLTESSRHTTENLAEHRLRNAVVIPHGVPRFPYTKPPLLWNDGRRATLRLITPGFFRADKGFEVVLKAVQRLHLDGCDVSYLIAGEAQGQFSGQAVYRQKIERLIRELGLDGIVRCDIRFLSVPQQIEAIQNSHFGVFAYQDPAQSSSGTIPLVMSAGRPVICTSFEYARSKREEGLPIILANSFGVADFTDAIEIAAKAAQRSDRSAEAYASTSDWAWTNVGTRFEQEFRHAARHAVSC